MDIILDNHMHLRRDGRFLDAVKEFKRYGGTHLIIAQYPMPSLVIREKSYMKAYQETLSIAREVREKTDVKAFVTIGPYPVDYLHFKDRFGREEAKRLMRKGMEEAVKLCEESDICVGIGEIGRPHFDVSREDIKDSNEIMLYGFELAKEYNLPVVLHTEKTTPELCKELATMADRIGFPREKIVKHFSPPLIHEHENHGLTPSLLSTWRNVIEAVKKGNRFLMETDYIDDPKRPGAVLSLRTVPRYTRRVIEEGLADEETMYRIHRDLPEKIYGIEME